MTRMTARMNVLVAIDHVSYNGCVHGAGRVFLNIVSKINQERFNVIPCVVRGQEKEGWDAQGLRIKCLGRGKFNPLVLGDFLKLLRAEKIDLVHLHQYSCSIIGRVAAMARGIPCIIHGHGLDYTYSWYQQIPDWLLAKATDRAIVVSNVVRDIYVKKRKIEPDKLVVMPNGIVLESFNPSSAQRTEALKQHLGLRSDHAVVGTVTRLREEKGNRYLLEAAAKVLEVLPKTYFLIVGDGPMLDDLKQRSRHLGIHHKVIFAGYQPDVAGMLSLFSIKVIASITEGHPLALLEAMAVGKAVVATDVGGIKEILKDGQVGLLVPPQDPKTMADKIVYLLRHETERVRFGARAYQESRQYSLDGYVRNLETLYEAVAGNSGTR